MGYFFLGAGLSGMHGEGVLSSWYTACCSVETKPDVLLPKAAQIYKPDLICYGQIIVELKAVKDIAQIHKAQVIDYLKASGIKLGLLMVFGTHSKASIVRLAY